MLKPLGQAKTALCREAKAVMRKEEIIEHLLKFVLWRCQES